MNSGKLTISKTVMIEAEPSDVFRALVDPVEIVRHFPFESVESDNRPGGDITFRGQVNGAPFTDHGRIDVLEPARRFQYTYWSDNHGTERTPENHLTINYELRPLEGGSTELVVTHSRIPPGEYHSVMLGAWDFLLSQLKSGLESGR